MNAHSAPDLKVLDDLQLLTDVVFDEPKDVNEPTDLAYARAFTGEAQPYWLADPSDRSPNAGERLKWLFEFYGKLRERHPNDENFRFAHGDYTFRAHRDKQFDGATTLSLRRIPEVCPELTDLELPPYYREFLMDETLLDTGGLVLIVAPVGNGKTTTISAALKSRAKAYGGVTVMVEDPCELHLKGFHGGKNVGEIRQYQIDPSLPRDQQFPEAVYKSLRKFPQTRGNKTIFISEIRDADTAVEACRAAQAGFTVFATLHASDNVNTVFRLITLLSGRLSNDAARDIVAGCLRLVVYQRLVLMQKALGWKRGKLTGEFLYLPHASHPAANTIRDAKNSITMLQDQINTQRNVMKEAHEKQTPFEDLQSRFRSGK